MKKKSVFKIALLSILFISLISQSNVASQIATNPQFSSVNHLLNIDNKTIKFNDNLNGFQVDSFFDVMWDDPLEGKSTIILNDTIKDKNVGTNINASGNVNFVETYGSNVNTFANWSYNPIDNTTLLQIDSLNIESDLNNNAHIITTENDYVLINPASASITRLPVGEIQPITISRINNNILIDFYNGNDILIENINLPISIMTYYDVMSNQVSIFGENNNTYNHYIYGLNIITFEYSFHGDIITLVFEDISIIYSQLSNKLSINIGDFTFEIDDSNNSDIDVSYNGIIDITFYNTWFDNDFYGLVFLFVYDDIDFKLEFFYHNYAYAVFTWDELTLVWWFWDNVFYFEYKYIFDVWILDWTISWNTIHIDIVTWWFNIYYVNWNYPVAIFQIPMTEFIPIVDIDVYSEIYDADKNQMNLTYILKDLYNNIITNAIVDIKVENTIKSATNLGNGLYFASFNITNKTDAWNINVNATVPHVSIIDNLLYTLDIDESVSSSNTSNCEECNECESQTTKNVLIGTTIGGFSLAGLIAAFGKKSTFICPT